MSTEILLLLSNTLTGIAAFFVGKRRSNAETDSVVLKNLELSVNLYAQIIKDLKTEIESLNVKIQELEQKIDVLHAENRKLKSKKTNSI
jgi:peptidoglycan hydrolase CwlO-like protein